MNLQASFGGPSRSESTSLFPWRFVATLSVLLMELTIIVSWLQLFVTSLQPASIGILILWFLIFGLAANGIHHLSNQGRLPNILLITFSIVFILLGLLISLNLVNGQRSLLEFRAALVSGIQSLIKVLPPSPEFLLMAFTIYIWRRGAVSASSTYLEQGRTGLKFRIGVLIFIVYMIIRGRSSVPPVLPLFFFSSLLAMSLTRANHISKLSAGDDPPFSLSWLLSLATLFLITMAAGLGVGRLFSSSLIDKMLGGLRQLILRIVLLIYQLILPLLLALDALLQRWVEKLIQEPESADTGPLEELFGTAGDWVGQDPPLLLQRFNEFLASLAAYWPSARIVLVSLILVIIFISSIRLVLRRSRREVGQQIGTDEGEDLPLAAEVGWRRRVREFGKEIRSWGQALVAGQLSTAIFIRRLYGRLLTMAKEQGRPRHPWETPLEFKDELAQLFPGTVPEIETLTEAYIRVRYGEFPETSDLVSGVRSAWQRIQEEYRS